MDRISNAFSNNNKSLITYIMGGDPDIKKTEELVYTLESAGADIIELGIPFTDPLADGPVIEKAATRALKSHTGTADFFTLVSNIRKNSEIAIVFMLYYNLVFKYGIDRFIQEAANAGVDGLIIPDLPPEEAEDLINACRKKNISTIFLAAPTSTDERFEKIVNSTNGFLYYVALTGITGAKITNLEDVCKRIELVKEKTTTPVAVGFGIKTPEDAAALAKSADGIIVGTSLVEIIDKYGQTDELSSKVKQYISSLKQAIQPTK